MRKLAWPTMIKRHPGAHLVVAMSDNAKAGAKLLARLFAGIGLSGDWAVQATIEPPGQYVECAFAERKAADEVAKMLGATGNAPGGTGPRAFQLDHALEA